jgi:RimJ/RimL family protein N-acetyltransferase
MSEIIEFDTPRLRLRQWRVSDREPFAALNADPDVMRFFPAPISREASDASIDAWQSQFAERSFGNWAAEVRETGEFIGFVGLTVPRRVLPFSPCVEIGWRLARTQWGKVFPTRTGKRVEPDPGAAREWVPWPPFPSAAATLPRPPTHRSSAASVRA